MSTGYHVRVEITTTRTVDISPERLAYLLDVSPETIVTRARDGILTGILRDEIRMNPGTAELLLIPGTQPTEIDCTTRLV